MRKQPLFLLLAVLSLLASCGHKEITVIKLQSLDEKYRESVPYQDGETFCLQHETDKTLIEYTVWRRLHVINEYDGESYYRFSPPPAYCWDNFQQDITECRTNYPLFNFEFRMSNEYKMDETFNPEADNIYAKRMSISVGDDFYAGLPFKGVTFDDYVMLDSLQVNGRTYYDVFQLDNQSYGEYGELHEGIQVLYYNYEDGIVGVEMSNGEKFMRYEE